MEQQLTAMTTSTESLIQAVERTQYAIDSVGEKTDEAVGRVGDQLEKVIVDTTQEVRATLGEITTTTGDAVRDTAKHLKAQVVDLVRTASEVQTTIDFVRAQMEQVVVETTRDVRAALEVVTTTTGQAVRDSAQRLDARVAELADTTSEIRTAVGAVGDAVNRLGGRIDDGLTETRAVLAAAVEQSGGDVRVALGDWADTVDAHASRIEMVSDTSGRTVRVLEETREVLDRLPQELSKTLQDVPVAVRQGIGDDLARVGGAVDRLNTTIKELHVVLRSQVRASRPEEPVTDDAAITNGAA
ncbi:hypothetical protein AB0K60_12195 [Thermopolyspora sp. NPDC052614]|uniref:hypothetical protein n=1 Tax=Thermopolyspora sp. NPDC052614 TaxID=3155682 RepID=UPI00342AAF83